MVWLARALPASFAAVPYLPAPAQASADNSDGDANCGEAGAKPCPVTTASALAQRLVSKAPDGGDGAGQSVVSYSNVIVQGDLDLRGLELVRGLRLAGPKCNIGAIALESAKLPAPIDISCFVRGEISFDNAVSDERLSFDGSTLAGNVSGGRARLGALSLRSVKAADPCHPPNVSLSRIVVAGDTDLSFSRGTLGSLMLDNATLGGMLYLGSTSAASIVIPGASVGGDVVADHAVAQGFNAADIRVKGSFVAEGASPGVLDLQGARLGELKLPWLGASTKYETSLKAANLSVAARSDITNAVLADAELSGAQLGGDLDLRGGRLGTFEAANASVGSTLQMASEFQNDVDLGGASIKGDLLLAAVCSRVAPTCGSKIGSAPASKYHSAIRANNLTVGGSLYFGGSEMHGAASFAFATVAGNIDMRGASGASLDLSGASVGEELRVWPNAGFGKLRLRDVSTRTFTDGLTDKQAATTQLPRLDLEGFTYRSLEGFDSDAETTAGETDQSMDLQWRNSDWLIRMLAKQDHFSFQPYQQLAAALRNVGRLDAANDVLREANWQDIRAAACHRNWFAVFRSLLLWAFIGWGLGTGYLHPFYIAALLTSFGAVLLWRPMHKADPTVTRARCIAASLSKLMPLPIGDAYGKWFDSKAHPRLGRWARGYFLLHSLVGALLAACVAAALAGFTQARS